MNNILIIANENKDKDLQYTKNLLNYLKGFDKAVSVYSYKNENKLNMDSYKEIDLVVSLGGDGTMLSSARRVAGYGIGILGINLGRLGFLTESKVDSFRIFDKIFEGSYLVDDRMMIEANTNYYKGLIALNDVILTRNMVSRMIRFKVFVNDSFVSSYSSDGAIFSTPTGSTAYSLSAGGPIIDPGMNIIQFTPICPHSLNWRSFILPENSVLRIEFEDYNGIILTADGQEVYDIGHNDIIEIKKSEHRMKIIRAEEVNFYELLRKKLESW